MAEPGLRVTVEDDQGNAVMPDTVVVEDESGDSSTALSRENPGDATEGSTRGVCGSNGAELLVEESGEFVVEVTCGDETKSKMVNIESGECGPITQDLSFTFPEGACEPCPEDGSGGDAGHDADTVGGTDAVGDAGVADGVGEGRGDAGDVGDAGDTGG